MTESSEPARPVPDAKDWTWVLGEPCPECGFDAAAVERSELSSRTREAASRFQVALDRPDAGTRPEPATWSALEYGCHVRDVCRVFDMRLWLMLADDNPTFANWDQDKTALGERYWEQEPSKVAEELAEAAEKIAFTLDLVQDDQWDRPGLRSNGSTFTVESISRYMLHDLNHHVHDVNA